MRTVDLISTPFRTANYIYSSSDFKDILRAMAENAEREGRYKSVEYVAFYSGFRATGIKVASDASALKQLPALIHIADKDCKNIRFITAEEFTKLNSEGVQRGNMLEKSNKVVVTSIAKAFKRYFDAENSGFTDKDWEEFTTAYKAQYELAYGDFTFAYRYGNSIKKAYHESSYEDAFGKLGTLWESCMRYVEGDFFNLYAANKKRVKLLVMLSPNKKIMARALVWTTDTGERVMDRIYYLKEQHKNMFEDYAKRNGIIRKEKQAHDYMKTWVTPEGNIVEKEFCITLENPTHLIYPYMDTFCYMDKKGRIVNYKLSQYSKPRVSMRSQYGNLEVLRD